jgi:hypothetical protein
LYNELGFPYTSGTVKDLCFRDDIFMMASALDPKYGFHWLQDVPGTPEEIEAIRQRIMR